MSGLCISSLEFFLFFPLLLFRYIIIIIDQFIFFSLVDAFFPSIDFHCCYTPHHVLIATPRVQMNIIMQKLPTAYVYLEFINDINITLA